VKVDLPIDEWRGDGLSVIEWIELQNLHRRHLTDDARALLAASLHELIEAETMTAQEQSRFNPESATAAAKKRRGKKLTADSPSPQKRDRKASESRTTAAKVGSKAKVSTHKAKQAIAVDKAIKAGEVSPDVRQEVLVGKKKLKDALPPKGRCKAQPPARPAACTPADDLRAPVLRRWETMRAWDKHWAAADMKEVRRLFVEVIREEQKQLDK
jgi:hypothetical protein